MTTPAKPTILVIDDHPDDLAQATRILNPKDYSVVTADGFEAAIAKAAAYEIDLLLCDTAFNSRGRERDLISEILSLPNRAEIPVIFTSSGQAAGVIRRQHRFGGAYHVKKPFDSAVLITLIERALWMPHFVQAYLSRPHFEVGPMAPAMPTVSIPRVDSN